MGRDRNNKFLRKKEIIEADIVESTLQKAEEKEMESILNLNKKCIRVINKLFEDWYNVDFIDCDTDIKTTKEDVDVMLQMTGTDLYKLCIKDELLKNIHAHEIIKACQELKEAVDDLDVKDNQDFYIKVEGLFA